jgi:hypothetical protein
MWVLARRELVRAGATEELVQEFTAAVRAAPTREGRIEKIRQYVDLRLIGAPPPDAATAPTTADQYGEIAVGGLYQTATALQQALRSGDADMTRHLLVVLMRDLFDEPIDDSEPTFVDSCMPTLLAALGQVSA